LVWQAAAIGELVGELGLGVADGWVADGRDVTVMVFTGTAAVGELEQAQVIRPITATAPIRSGFIVVDPFGQAALP